MPRSERDKYLNRKIDQRIRQQQEEERRRREQRELRQRERAAIAARPSKELTGEVKPTPPGKNDEQKIITVPFDGTIKSVSYSPNEYLHVGAQGTGIHLRDLQLYVTSPQKFIHVATLHHGRITLGPKQEVPLDLASWEGSALLDVKKGDELVWLSESVRETWGTDFNPADVTGQKDSGDPGGIVKVVVAAAPWLREV